MRKLKKLKKYKIHSLSFVILALIIGIYCFSSSATAKIAVSSFASFAKSSSAPIYRIEEAKGVALECMVYWESSNIDEIINIAQNNKISITFFVSNSWAQNNQAKINNILENKNNNIALLGFAKTEVEFIDELKLAKLQNINTNLYMPYYPEVFEIISESAKKQNTSIVFSSFDILNKSSDKQDVVNRIVNNSFDGAIIRFEPTKTVKNALNSAINQLELRNKNIFNIQDYIK